jgi:hypothetical protein
MIKYEHYKNIIFHYAKSHLYDELFDVLNTIKNIKLNNEEYNKLLVLLNKSLNYNNNLIIKMPQHLQRLKDIIEYLQFNYINEYKINFLNLYIF